MAEMQKFIEKSKERADSVCLGNQVSLYKKNDLHNKQQFLKQNKRKGNLNTATASRIVCQLTEAECELQQNVKEAMKIKFI